MCFEFLKPKLSPPKAGMKIQCPDILVLNLIKLFVYIFVHAINPIYSYEGFVRTFTKVE